MLNPGSGARKALDGGPVRGGVQGSPMARAPTLSKSRFTYGLQCHKHLWWRCHDAKSPELIPSAQQRAGFARGHRVGEEACRHVPGGVQIPFDGRQKKKAVEATRQAIADGAGVLYEAAFEYEAVFASIDILVREAESWVLVEVKSTTGVKSQHIPDAAVQTWITRSCGIPVHRVELMHLNRDCVFPDLSNLFTRTDISDKVEEFLPQVAGEVKAQKGMLDLPIPIIAAGPQCRSPYECPFLARCNDPLPSGHVSELHGVGRRRSTAYLEAGVERILDLDPGDVPAGGIWARQSEAARSGALVVDADLGKVVPPLDGVIGYLDFETTGPAVPVWEGCSPFDSIPAQFSLHTRRDGALEHREWLAAGPADPRVGLAEKLVEAAADCEVVFAYNAPFEKRCIASVADTAPRYRTELLEIRDKVRDLHPLVRDYVYHPDFAGSFSLKSVLPVLVDELDYSDLRIADGQFASSEIESLLLRADELPDWRLDRMRSELRAYCERDTLGLVRLHEWLAEHSS